MSVREGADCTEWAERELWGVARSRSSEEEMGGRGTEDGVRLWLVAGENSLVEEGVMVSELSGVRMVC